MNLLDPVMWGVRATYAVTSTAVQLGLNAVQAAEALLGRTDRDDDRFAPVARTPQGTTPPVAPRRDIEFREPEPIPRGERLARDVEPLASRRAEGNGSTVVETEGAAAPSATIAVDTPWADYDDMTAADIVKRLRRSDEATKAVVLLYERANKGRKSVVDAAL
jgi:hypothetical protein